MSLIVIRLYVWDVNWPDTLLNEREGVNFKAAETLVEHSASVYRVISISVSLSHGPSLADAPWSSKCRTLFPVLEDLGIKYKNHSTVTIAKIDITANDIQLMYLDRYPFFRLFPANSQQVRGSWTVKMKSDCYYHKHNFSLCQLCLLPNQLHAQL